jgi:hypothetical protein
MQISRSREYYSCWHYARNARLDARTTNTVHALYVPEKLNRRECGIALCGWTRLSGLPTADKKPLRRQANEAVFLLRRNAPSDSAPEPQDAFERFIA